MQRENTNSREGTDKVAEPTKALYDSIAEKDEKEAVQSKKKLTSFAQLNVILYQIYFCFLNQIFIPVVQHKTRRSQKT